jgi:hypothetical protein
MTRAEGSCLTLFLELLVVSMSFGTCSFYFDAYEGSVECKLSSIQS